jgi:dTMP kinase
MNISIGKYICVSGGEGVGKTTLVRGLHRLHPDWLLVKEPGGTELADKLRTILTTGQYHPNPWTEFHLLMAARLDLYQEIITPALTAGRTVLSDRCWVDTLAAQVIASGNESAVQHFINHIQLTKCPWPDLWMWLDLDPQEAMKRSQQRGHLSTFDRRPVSFHLAVKKAFATIPKYIPQFNYLRIDAQLDPEEILNQAVLKLQA